MIGIIDYGMGNLRSVSNALEVIGESSFIAERPADLKKASIVILPGVGAFGDGIRNLREGGWVDALETEVRQLGKPFLGICLGMQLLATTGYEHGTHAGLGWVPGVCIRLEPTAPAFKVPHIGWNDVRVTRTDGLFTGLGERPTFYFVHSFILRPEEHSAVTGWCDHGGEFAAAVEDRNISAIQFHPEKSQKAGLSVLRNFVRAARLVDA